jgi:hypothetical protein
MQKRGIFLLNGAEKMVARKRNANTVAILRISLSF